MPQFGSIVGQIIGGEPKVLPIPYDQGIQTDVTGYRDWLNRIRGLDESDLAGYSTALKSIFPEATKIAGQDVATFGDLINRNLNYDPLSSYERIRTGNLAALGDWAAKLGGFGSSADKLALAARGYGNRGGSSYENILRTDRISKNIAPVVGSVLSNLGRDTGITQADRLNNIINTYQLMQARSDVPFRNVDRLLSPIQARGTTAAGSLANFGNLAGTARSNIAGFKEKKSPWQLAGEAGDELVNTYMQLYGLGGLGGAGGGSMAGIFGAGKPGAAGGGGGTGLDLNAIMKMFNLGGGGGGGGGGGSAQAPGYYWNNQYQIPGVNTGY